MTLYLIPLATFIAGWVLRGLRDTWNRAAEEDEE
jgi:hypothetical protein